MGQPPSSPGVDWTATPLAWPFVLLTAVDDEEMDELEEMEEAEFVLERVFRGIKTPLTSSELTVELRDWLPLSPHADRSMFAKLGGLATAVMRSVGGHVWRARKQGWGRGRGRDQGVAEQTVTTGAVLWAGADCRLAPMRSPGLCRDSADRKRESESEREGARVPSEQSWAGSDGRRK